MPACMVIKSFITPYYLQYILCILDICSLPKDIGECFDMKPMYYYESEVSQCVKFQACMTGNYNRYIITDLLSCMCNYLNIYTHQ